MKHQKKRKEIKARAKRIQKYNDERKKEIKESEKSIEVFNKTLKNGL